MRLLLSILFLLQVLLCSGNTVLNCDDAEAITAGRVALDYINRLPRRGYKFDLERIENIYSLPSHGNGELYHFELDLIETTCPHVSPTSPENCPIRSRFEQVVEGDCDVRLLKINNTFTVTNMKCKSKIDSAEKFLRDCPNCPFLAPFNDTRVVHAVDVSLHKFNSGNSTVYYHLHEIGRGQIQQTSTPNGVIKTTAVEFIAVASNCTKEDINAGLSPCVDETGLNAHFATCSGTVEKLPEAVDEDVAVQCTVLEPQPALDAQAPQPVPAPPMLPGLPPSRFHHNLNFNNLSPHSSESHSAEQVLLAAHAKQKVRRSLTGEPVQAQVARVPLCPGIKLRLSHH
ncbi:alpha-2-HS-glycoprotein [Hyperolius riggenbachi]|uniref:alpha-2-HS-glycoprotein n=1 Tax=Hyperolius riggenbachi TaxID=752182 RepID=UPI0035A3761C